MAKLVRDENGIRTWFQPMPDNTLDIYTEQSPIAAAQSKAYIDQMRERPNAQTAVGFDLTPAYHIPAYHLNELMKEGKMHDTEHMRKWALRHPELRIYKGGPRSRK